MKTIKYDNPPSKEELIKKMKEAFAKMGYDTDEKRAEWYRKQQPIAIIATGVYPRTF